MIYKFSYRKKGFFSSVRSTIELMRLEVRLEKCQLIGWVV